MPNKIESEVVAKATANKKKPAKTHLGAPLQRPHVVPTSNLGSTILAGSREATVSLVRSSFEAGFGDAEQFLLDQARERFDFEQKSAAALHSKTTLFLALVGVFATTAIALIGRMIERTPISTPQISVLVVLLLSMGVLTVVAVILGRSTMSRSYQVVAAPSKWIEHLARLRQSHPQASIDQITSRENDVLTQLKKDTLNAWVEACDASTKENDKKAASLDRVVKLLTIAIFLAFVGVLLFVAQAMISW